MTLWQRGLLAWVLLMCPACAFAQTPVQGAEVKGTVVDATGAQIGGATVHAEATMPARSTKESGAALSGRTRDITADASGHFLLALPAGTYTLTVQAPGFDPYVRENVRLDAGQHIQLQFKLLVAAVADVVNVTADSGTSTDPADNKSAITFKADQLDVFSDDSTVLQQQLTALAGGDPSLPPQVLVDGFSNGQFPPKSSIREIRINQNPFSAQYDQPGQGRVEVFTKPGSQKLHAYLLFFGNDSSFNARNPYINGAQPPYSREHLFGDIGGPLGKKTSFDFGTDVNHNDNNSPVNATVLDSSLNQVQIQDVVPSPSLSQNYTVRLDRQIGANDTGTFRYSINRSTAVNGGLGPLILGSEATNSYTLGQTVQAGDTHVIGTKVVAESRFQYNRTQAHTDPVSTAPTLIVQGAFNGGGAPGQLVHDHTDRFEFQEYISIALKNHFIRTGARYRLTRDANLSTGDFNGQYIFPNIADYVQTLKGTPGYGPSQFSLTQGQPSAQVLTGDVGVYAEDDWKARPDLTVSYGGRIESQSAVPDHLDLVPRLGAAWAPVFRKSKTPWFTVRAGFGMFYDRFDSGNLLQTVRQNGVLEQSFYQENPPFACSGNNPGDGTQCTPTVPTGSLTSLPSSIYKLSPNLHEEYLMQGGITVERSFGQRGSGSVGWIRARGVHQFELLNVNAPLPGTPGSTTRPLGGTQNIYQYSSEGVRNQDTFRSNVNYRPTRHIFVWAFYTFGSREGDSNGASSLPTDSYNLAQDYGPTSGTVAQALYTGGGGDLPWGFDGNIFIAARSEQRFNITTGTDLNGDTAYNDRPAFATDLTRASVVKTAFGNFDASPTAGQTIIPINYGVGPRLFYSEMDIGRSFYFGKPTPDAIKAAADAKVSPGKKAAKPEQPYRFALSMEVDNVLNHNNPGPPVGVLPTPGVCTNPPAVFGTPQCVTTSPYFGKSISLNAPFSSNGAANRTVSLGAIFSF